MNANTKVQEIHASDMYGIVIETGCGAAITSELMSESHASATIYFAKQPYSKDYEELCYGSFKRSVSKEFVKAAMKIEVLNNSKSKCNFAIVTSWQLSDNDPNKYCHGWFAFFNKKTNTAHYLHYSFPKGSMLDRHCALNAIGAIGVDIIHTSINGNMNGLKSESTSAVLDMAYIEHINDFNQQFIFRSEEIIDYDLVIGALENNEQDYMLVFDKDGSMIRIEDFARTSKEFIIQKGSFNPLQHGHMHLMKHTRGLYPNASAAFLISTYRYDKPHVETDELHDRVKNITSRGYPLIICKEKYFYGTCDLLKKWVGDDCQFYYPVGMDTINRIYQTDLDYNLNLDKYQFAVEKYISSKVEKYKNNFTFMLYDRLGVDRREETHAYDGMVKHVEDYIDDGISSSDIRNGNRKNLLNNQ